MLKSPISFWNQVRRAVGLGCCLAAAAVSAHGAPLAAGEPILLGQTQDKFDFIRIDTARHRLLLAHTGNKTLDVFDLDSKKLLQSVPTGAAQDAAVDEKHGRYFASVSAPPRLAIIDADKLEMTGEVVLPAAADLMAFDPANGRAYVCNDTAAEIWVIDPEAKKIVSTITLSGKSMEGITFDPQFKNLFQMVSATAMMFVIDPADNKVLRSSSVEPALKPHGVALVPEADTLLVAGGSGKLALLNRTTGKVVASADMGNRVDEMAYDPGLHIAYCPDGAGKITAVGVDGDKLTPLGDVSGALGRSVVVDPKTHVVWIAANKGDQCFVQPFTPVK